MAEREDRMTDMPRIQYCRSSDGVDLAYFVVGNGPPLIWTSPIFTSHLAVNWGHWPEAFLDIARYCTLIKYDGRGSGLSDREATDFSLPARVLDIEAVRQSAGFDKVSLIGGGHGCLAAAAYAGENGDHVDRLVLVIRISPVKSCTRYRNR